jgi:tRNA/rRNA methyltransferase
MTQIHFILVEPAVPENVGFSVRALKTMGFDSFRLVNPCDHLSKPARKTAYASHDLLESTKVFENFEESISDLDLTIATTAKQRTSRVDVLHPDQLPQLIKSKGSFADNIGVIFGREESGLTTEEINKCDVVSTIPLKTSYPSLNLAQSVLLYAYELSSFNRSEIIPRNEAEDVVSDRLRNKAIDTLEWLELTKQPSLYQRILDRIMLLDEDDTHLLLSTIKKLEHKRRMMI